MTELKFVFGDPEICSGCMVCANVCSMYYSKVISPERARVRVLRVEPALDFPLFCRNCEDAPCIAACPEGALSRTSKGIIIVNNRLCKGSGECVKACPYNAIHINPDTGKAIKCIQCGECVDRCPADALFMTTEEDLAKKDPDERMRNIYDRHRNILYSKEEGI
ncbi:MAG: 4Fe-4S dicluster domain-containing protein [Candidatus Thorarchaeota archaeon]|nr:MAG: 4Fe-4S dicluster domain-containing protein [Candidatus Thorarchaeota archaeon]RLI59838.1 MAG: 4Fe-4S dicluster domain-containing protein [Candidatus Thorarchaeota archaeon]